MSWTNRVVWQEGMFLRTQHFQQQDRWMEQLVRARVQALRPHPWGLVEYSIDRDLLGTGRFALSAAAGVFEDGTPFALPGETDHPPPLELPETARNVLVYLALPIRQAGAVEVADASTEGRYHAHPFEAYDTHSASPQPAELQIGRLRLRYLLETDERTGYLCIGLARITEVTADRRVMLDDRWIPPSLVCSAAGPLSGLIAELSGMLNQSKTSPSTMRHLETSLFLNLWALRRNNVRFIFFSFCNKSITIWAMPPLAPSINTFFIFKIRFDKLACCIHLL